MKSKLTIESDDMSIYGTIEYDEYKYPFRLVYTGKEDVGESQKIVFDRPTPKESEWLVQLTTILIDKQLI